MKKAILAVVLVAVLSLTVMGSTMSWVYRFGDLFKQYSDMLTWVTQDMNSRHLVGAFKMQEIVDTATGCAIQAILEASTTNDAKIAVGMVYELVGMQLAAEGMRDLDDVKGDAAVEIIGWGTEMIVQLVK